MKRMRAAACALTLALLVGAACGGDGDRQVSEARDPTTTSSPPRAADVQPASGDSGPSRDGGPGERVGVEDEVRITVEG